MILKLHGSKLFTVDPAIRFGKQHGLPKEVWNEVWKRYLSGYDLEALAGYVLYKTGTRIRTHTIRQWLLKTEVYCKANHIMLMGVRVVHSEFFGEHENFVLEEVLTHLKYGEAQESRTIV